MNSSVTHRIALPALQKIVTEVSKQFGFDSAGVAADSPAAELEHFSQWIDAGRGGEMAYLAQVNESGSLKRSALRNALPWARSIVVCSCSYDSEAPYSTDPASEASGWIARYAQPGNSSGAGIDYHDVMLARLRGMEADLHRQVAPLAGEFVSRSYVDTGPLVERVFARHAGLGWIAKNTCLINERRGSWLFLAAIVTSIELEDWQPTAKLAPDRCGACTRCIDACPTGALDQPYTMDATRCISYLTIEKKGTIAEELRGKIGRNVFGCDICQDVCPWNNKAHREGKNQSKIFAHTRSELVNPSLAWLAGLSREDFKKYFRGTPLERTGWGRVMRNVAIAMGNSGREEFLDCLGAWSQFEADPNLAEAAQWAERRIRQAAKK